MKKGYIPKHERKKILLITDDIRVHSGVAQIGRETVLGTLHKYNWVQIAGAVKHPDKGKILDISKDLGGKKQIEDASVILYPSDGYGDPMLLREVIKRENPDALFLITDPRYFIWVFEMENEIRKQMPIVYLNIWDDYPAPAYNREYYESCDALFGISKQTVNINKLVLGEKADKKIIKYVPHGLDNTVFKPVGDDNEEFVKFKKQVLGDKEYDFVLLFNSRNIRRKQIPDTLMAWKVFIDGLPKEKQDKCLLLLKTEGVSDHGTDLFAVIEYLFPENPPVKIIHQGFDSQHMSYLYNVADGVILLTSNEGWGLSLTEALLTGKPIIANVTGGMQDQMRFVDDKGKWFIPDAEIPSNNTGRFKQHGEWAFPVYPTNRSLQGSPLTPYIWDDRCDFEDAAQQIRALYDLSPEERKAKGLKGCEWANGDEAGFTTSAMAQRIIDGIDKLFDEWEPRERFEFVKDTEIEPRVLPHKIIY